MNQLLVVLFLPPLILSFFNNLTVKIISAIYQAFIFISFSVIVIGVVGTIVSICSIIVTVLVEFKRKKLVT